MKFLRFFKPKKEDRLVLDFGTSSVKGLIFERKAKKNVIKKFSIGEIEKFGVLGADDFESAIIKKAAQKVIDGLGIENQVSEFPAIIGFSPKILKGRIVEVPFKRKNRKQRITREEEQRIYDSILKKAAKQVCQEFLKEFGIIPQDLEILKKEILEKKISGYKVLSILESEGENLNFKILIIFGLRDNLKIFQQLKSFLGSKDINLFHEIEGLVSLTSRNKNMIGIFLDIGKEFTQIFSIKRGVLDPSAGRTRAEWIEEFPMGGDAFTKDLCQNLGLTEREGENLKLRLSKNQLSGGTRERIENLISETSKLWFSQLKEKLKKKAKIYSPLAGTFYLFGGGSCLPAIKKVLEEGSFEDLPLPQIRKVNFLRPQNLFLENKTGLSLSAQAIPAILLTFSKYAKKNY